MKGRRIRAGLVDLAVAVGWAAVVAAAAAAVHLWVGLGAVPPLQLNVLLGGLVVLPVIGWLAVTEGGRYGASLGKQWLGLRVQRAGGGPLGRGRALLRNLVKVGVPWLIGHAAVLAVVTGSSPVAPDVWILVAIAVLLPVVYLASCLLEDGRTPYDHAAGSRVVVSAAGRRFAED